MTKFKTLFFINFSALLFCYPVNTEANIIVWLNRLGKIARVPAKTTNKAANVLKSNFSKGAAATTGIVVADGVSSIISNSIITGNKLFYYVYEDVYRRLKIRLPTGDEIALNVKSAPVSNVFDDIIDPTLKTIEQKGLHPKVEMLATEEAFAKYAKHFNESKSIEKLTIKTSTGIQLKTRLIEDDIKPIRLIEVNPGVVTEFSTLHNIDNMNWLFAQPIHKMDIRVISLFDELDVSPTRNISAMAGELHIPYNTLMKEGIEKTITKLKRKTVFIIGHVENNKFVIRTPSNTILDIIDIKNLEYTCRKNHVNLVVLGCNGGRIPDVSGFLGNVRDVNVLDGLNRALKSKNYGELFSSFGNISSPLKLQPLITDKVAFQVKAVRNITEQETIGKLASINCISVTTASRLYVNELNARLIWFFPSGLHKALLFIYLLSIITFRACWRKLRDLWILPECISGKRLKYITLSGLRILLYIISLPIYTMYNFIETFFLWPITHLVKPSSRIPVLIQRRIK